MGQSQSGHSKAAVPSDPGISLSVYDEQGHTLARNPHLSAARDDAPGHRSRSNSNASQTSHHSANLSPSDAHAGSRRSSVDSEYSYRKGERLPYVEHPGPIANRKCRDWFWALLFIAFWLGMVAVGIFASQEGNAKTILYGTDYEGNLCGVASPTRDLTNMPYLFLFESITFDTATLSVVPQTGLAVCVSSCPSNLFDYLASGYTSLGNPANTVCTYGYPQPNDTATLHAAVSSGNCSAIVFPSDSLLYRCVPSITYATTGMTVNVTDPTQNSTMMYNVTGAQYIDNVVSLLNTRNIAQQIFRDLYTAWPYILATAAIAVGGSFLWLFVIQLLAGPVVWLSILLFLASILGLAAYLWYQYYLLTTPGTTLSGLFVNFSQYQLSTYIYNRTTFLVLACIVSAFFLIMFLVMLFLRKRINLAIALIKISCRALRRMPTIFFIPYIKVILLLIATVWAVYTTLLLATAGKPTTFAINGVAYLTFSTQNLIAYLTIYVVFGYFWAWNFIIAIMDTVVAGSVATWYWTRDKKKLPWFIVLPSFWRVFRFHLGSLAFGSLIIAIVQFIRYLLMRLQKSLKKAKNPVLTCIFVCLQCCFACVERFLKFINRYAYVEIAVYGYSFCKAASTAFQLITRNVIRVSVVDKISDFVLFTSRMILTIVATVIGNHWLLTSTESPTYWAMPLVLMFFLSFGITYLFVVVISMSITTIFVCFCEDTERNDGSPEKPYYMVKSLKKFVDRHARDQTDLAKP